MDVEPCEESKEKDEKKATCRVCLTFDCDKFGEGLSLFEQYNDVYVYEKINYIASIEIEKDDNLPDRICSVCLLALESACNFKQQCERSDAILHSPILLREDLHKQIENPIKEEIEIDELEYDYLESSPIPETDIETILDNEVIEHNTREVPFKSKAIDLKLECHDCGGSFKSKCKLRVHWKKVHLPQQLICAICKKTHKTFKSYHNHIKRKTKNCINAEKIRVEGEGKSRIFCCKDCDSKSKRIHTMMAHIVIHTGERPFVCSTCGKTFTQRSSLIGHKETAHNVNVKEGTCDQCGKHIRGRDKWYKHMRRHTTDKLPCSVCNKVYSSQSALTLHMKRHSGVKSYTCEFCAKTFYISSDLRNHKVKIHFKNKFYSCEQCKYRTLNFASMSKHRKRHTGNNVACDVCGTFVENQQQLMLHKKRHFEKNFKCTLCDKTYYARKNLQAHTRKVHNLYAVGSTFDRNSVKKEVKTDSQLV